MKYYFSFNGKAIPLKDNTEIPDRDWVFCIEDLNGKRTVTENPLAYSSGIKALVLNNVRAKYQYHPEEDTVKSMIPDLERLVGTNRSSARLSPVSK